MGVFLWFEECRVFDKMSRCDICKPCQVMATTAWIR